MGGDLGAESTPGGGSRFGFTVRLGVAEAAAGSAAPAAVAARPAEVSAPAPRAPDLATLAPRLDELRTALAAGDARARAVGGELVALLAGSTLEPAFAPIAGAIARFDFPGARAALDGFAAAAGLDLQ